MLGILSSATTMRAGNPARAEAVKSGCSSLVNPTSLMASSANCRFSGGTYLKSRQPLFHLVDANAEPAWSASSTSAERITAAIISRRSVIPSSGFSIIRYWPFIVE